MAAKQSAKQAYLWRWNQRDWYKPGRVLSVDEAHFSSSIDPVMGFHEIQGGTKVDFCFGESVIGSVLPRYTAVIVVIRSSYWHFRIHAFLAMSPREFN